MRFQAFLFSTTIVLMMPGSVIPALPVEGSIVCGWCHTFMLKSDGPYGQLGTEDTANRTTFMQVLAHVKSIACGGSHTFVIKADGTIWATGWNEYGQLRTGDTKIEEHLQR